MLARLLFVSYFHFNMTLVIVVIFISKYLCLFCNDYVIFVQVSNVLLNNLMAIFANSIYILLLLQNNYKIEYICMLFNTIYTQNGYNEQ